MTKYIKAPYNFIPLSEKVIFPEWSNIVSHDIPFKDGNSGVLKLKIKAASPIILKENNESVDSFNVNNTHLIPGSSIKGMLRSVLEVMSFSKMSGSNVDDTTYSLRDLNNKKDYDPIKLAKDTHCGYLRYDGENYWLKPCGKPGRIPHPWIDKHYKTQFESFFNLTGREKFKGNNEAHKSAKYKYEMFGNHSLHNTFKEKIYGKGDGVRTFYEIDSNADRPGELVFTGQPGPRNKTGNKVSGKIHEFIFFESDNSEIKLSREVIDTFFFAYFDHDKNQQSIDFSYRREQLKNNRSIPIFYRYENKKEGAIKDMGLSYMYKIVYKHSVLDLVPAAHRSLDIDLPQTIFGYTDSQRAHKALKGRVHVGHAPIDTFLGTEEEVTVVLGNPKASYIPNYIKQQGEHGISSSYNSYMNEHSRISGWKRYPVHKHAKKTPTNFENNNIVTRFKPLKTGTSFTCSISVHNLRDVELGALISAITLHGSEDTYHTLGLAKPFGYGKVSLELDDFDFENKKLDYFLKCFESYVNMQLGHDVPKWHQSAQMKELASMTTESDRMEKELSYMQMDVQGENAFVQGKNNKEYLQSYSVLSGNTKGLESKLSLSEYHEFKKRELDFSEQLKRAAINIDEIQDRHVEEQCKKVRDALQEEKEQLSRTLQGLQQHLEETYTTLNKQLKKESLGDTIQLDHVDVTSRNAFDDLKKEVHRYAEIIHGKNNYKQVLNTVEHPYFLTTDEQLIRDKTEAIYTSLNQKHQKKKKSVFDKKILEWFGQV